MKAIGFYKPLPVENKESLIDVDVLRVEPTGKDILVKIKAVSVNPVDVKVRQRPKEDQSTASIIGWDASGIVEAVGDAVSLFKPGDKVYYAGDHFRQGSNCEYQLVDERLVGSMPSSLTFEEAAAMPLTTITAWEALFERLGIEPSSEKNIGKSILIIGGAGGVGSIATQLAKKVAGLIVVSTASRPESETWCRQMGADQVINHHLPFKDEFLRIKMKEVNYILCLNSLEKHIENMADVIKPQGRICTIVETKDNQAININIFQSKSVGFLWELMFTRSLYQTEDMQEQHNILNRAAKLFDEGLIKSTLTESFGDLTAENLRKAHARVETGSMVGKLVLSAVE
jgi:zinc-binding alcohol dehydrogenase family protein